jgi:hypothetical protein
MLRKAETTTEETVESIDAEPLAWPISSLVRLRAFEALRHRDYRLLWYGQIFGSMGTWMDQVTRGWLIYELTSWRCSLDWCAVSRQFHFYYCRQSPAASPTAIRASLVVIAQFASGFIRGDGSAGAYGFDSPLHVMLRRF